MYTNSDYEESNWANEYGVYIVWHGELPESPYH
jgi:hypothetical protein